MGITAKIKNIFTLANLNLAVTCNLSTNIHFELTDLGISPKWLYKID
jgi:hypothetical protein